MKGPVFILFLVSFATAEHRRVWVQYKHGQHDECYHSMTSMFWNDDPIQIHYDFVDEEAFVATASEEEISLLSSNPAVVQVVEDVPRYPMHVKQSIEVRNLQGGEETPYGIRMVQADQAHAAGVTGAGVKVCVIDSGIDGNHEDFRPGSLSGLNQWQTDGVGHGTHCAGTIAAAENGVGVVGVAPDADLYIVKVFGDDGGFVYSSGLVDAANKCRDAGAKIISMSLGGPLPNPFEWLGFSNLLNEGVLSIAAAGNGGNTGHSYPASYDGVISVAAVDNNKAVAQFSQRNNRVDVAAPGVDVLSTFPTNGCQICDDLEPPVRRYGIISGTSMACPHVAGVAALLWSFKPSATVQDIIRALQSTADDVDGNGRDNKYGNGIVRAMEGLKDLNGGPLAPMPTPPPTPAPTDAPFCEANDYVVEISILTDDYGNETFWSVSNQASGFTLLAGAALESNTQYSIKKCLQADCYTFEIVDAASDGICCNYGSGNYRVDVNGDTIASGGSFSGAEVTTFGQCSGATVVKPDPVRPPTAPPTVIATTPPPTSKCIDFQLLLSTDRYPEEITVSIELNGVPFYNLDGGSLSANTDYELSDCLDSDGCYEFIIEDSYGDGLCCTYGRGSFQVNIEGQTKLSSNRSFSRESVTFGNGC